MRIFATDLKVGDFIIDDGEPFEVLSIRRFPISSIRPQGIIYAYVDVMHSGSSPFVFSHYESITIGS